MNEKSVLVVQHAPWEGPGRIAQTLQQNGLAMTILHLADMRDGPLADVRDLAGLILMGGPMGAWDLERYPALGREIQLVREAINEEVPVLGICLGHQIIAASLGAQLRRADAPEHGVGTVRTRGNEPGFSSKAGERSVLHWHRDHATLPPGATLLAESDAVPNQAFRYGSALGLQFHLEVGDAELVSWLGNQEMCADISRDDALAIRDDLREKGPEIRAFADEVFGAFASSARRHRER